MTISLEAADALESAIDRKIENAAPKRTRAAATVTRRDSDGTVYVRLEGAETETPVSGTAAAVKPGDVVGVTVDNGRLTIDGNYSAPATDDTAALIAQSMANSAQKSAETASAAAGEALSSAAVAAEAAESAQDSLKSVVQGATTVEKAVSVMQTALEAVVDYDPQNDTVTEYFWHDSAGAHVLGDTSGYRNDITSSGMDFKQVSTERSVAQFGAAGARIGKDYDAQAADNESHMELDYHSMQLFDADGERYFHVSDLRDRDGFIVETFTAPGGTNIFKLMTYPSSNPRGWATIDGETATVTNLSTSSQHCTVSPTPEEGAVVVIGYIPRSYVFAKAFTFGTRIAAEQVGAMSFCEGIRNVARGEASHAEGEHNVANEYGAHAEGAGCTALGSMAHAEGSGTLAGYAAHAEGQDTTASQTGSHSQNVGTKAAKMGQTALGSYNVADAASTTTHPSGTNSYGQYAVIIGNGTSDNVRSNALTVDWSGNVGIAGDVQDMSGNQLYADATHTHSTSDITGLGAEVSNDISSDSAVSIANNSWRTLGSITLTTGKWVVMAGVRFPSNSSGARFICLSDTTNASPSDSYRRLSMVSSNAVSGGETALRTTSLMMVTGSSWTCYAVVYQSSGSALNCTGRIRAFRIA